MSSPNGTLVTTSPTFGCGLHPTSLPGMGEYKQGWPVLSAATLSRTGAPPPSTLSQNLGSFPIPILSVVPSTHGARLVLCFLLGVKVRGGHVAACCHLSACLQPCWATAQGMREALQRASEKG